MTDDEKREAKREYVYLKEHFEKLWIEREKLLDYKFQAAAEALKLAADRLKEHLNDLNNSHQRAKEKEAEFVKKETYDTKTAYYDEWCRGVDKKLAYWSAAIVVIVFLIELGVKFWR